MGSALVVYRSHYGATRRYAEWIANALSATLCEAHCLRREMLECADIVIFGSGLYAGNSSAAALLKRHATQLSGKCVVLFAVGLADPAKEENVQRVRRALEKKLGEQMKTVAFFYFRGAMDFASLKFFHKAGMRAMKGVLERKKDRSQEDEEALASFEHPVDFTQESAILPLVSYCKEHGKR